MHIELTEVFCCPDCGPGHGLVAFVERIRDRRILAGRLDCPVCECRHPIVEGVLRLGAADAGAQAVAGLPAPPPDGVALVNALLGPPTGPETLLLAGDAAAFASGLAAARPSAAVLTFGPPPTDLGDRVFPIVPLAPEGTPPLLPGTLDGVVVTGAGAEGLTRFAPLLRSGARFVALTPDETPEPGPDSPLTPLVADERAWVAERR